MMALTETNKASKHFEQFDGLRGLAIIFVVLSHCNLLVYGGWIADAVFFALAGFFVINPFKEHNEQRFLSLWGILKFYKNRAIRILPAYYLILIFVCLHSDFVWITRDMFIRLLFFGDIWGTLWFMYAYFWLMFIVPYILLVHQLLAKKIRYLNNDLICGVIFIVLGGAFRLLILYLKVYDFRIEQLMVGIGSGYICRYIRNNEKLNSFAGKHKVLGESLSFLILLLILAFSSKTLMNKIDPVLGNDSVGHRYLFGTSIVMGLLLILLSMYSTGFSAKLLSSKILLFLGKISYTVYLIHMFILLQLNVRSDVFSFMLTFALSIVLAYLIDSVIAFVINKFKMLKPAKAKTL